jgi:prolyl oligopeptidase
LHGATATAGDFAHFFKEPGGEWRQLADFGQAVVQIVFGPHDDLYVLHARCSARALAAPVLSDLTARASEVIAQGSDTIVSSFWSTPSIAATDSRLYVTYQLGGPSEIRAFTLEGQPAQAPEQRPVASSGGIVPVAGDNILFRTSTFVDPSEVRYFDAALGTTVVTAIRATVPARFENVEVIREMATSADGTQVPVNIMRPVGAPLDGSSPLILTGYGGYGVSLAPGFSTVRTVLLHHGV